MESADHDQPADCRICRSEVLPLLLACKCTQGHMHAHCLQKWIEINGNICEVCLTEYTLPRLPTLVPDTNNTNNTVNISFKQILMLYTFSIVLAITNALVDNLVVMNGMRFYTCMMFTLAYAIIAVITVLPKVFDISLILLTIVTAFCYVISLLLLGAVDWISVLQVYILICLSLLVVVLQISIDYKR